MSSRERLAKASTSSDLGWDSNQEKDVDNITALGIIQLRDSRILRLGRLLIMLRGYEEVRSKTDLQDRMIVDREDAASLIATILRNKPNFKPLTEKQCNVLCRTAMLEWVLDRCRYCHGAAQIKRDDGVIMTCEKCNGTGKHRYSNGERADNLGIGIGRLMHYDAAIGDVIALCGTADALAMGAAHEYLEKYGS